MTTLRLSGPALWPDGHIYPAMIDVADGKITRMAAGTDRQADIVTDGCIAPGLIDLQLNGAWGHDFTSDGSSVAEVAARLPSTGVTAFLPTIITSTFEAYSMRLAEIRTAAAENHGAHILGVHLEGPYINPVRKGAHDPALIRPIDLEELAHWAADPLVKLITLAPELPHALDAIRLLRARGVVVSAGHSDASYAAAAAGFAAGIGWGTHVFNAMSGVQHREPGLATALLAEQVPCGLIPDGVHVHPALLKLIWRVKGVAELVLVTDAMAAMGMPPGRYRLADREVVVDATSARLADGTLAGSILRMDQAIRNMVQYTGCSLAEALQTASTTPARVLGLAHKGELAPGCDADLVVLNTDLDVTHTLLAGRIAYQA